ncbi:hypothetical protein C3920_14490 [Novacetimonas pomaceti]|uniref:Uncharacterized protein n=1 Tax=Novacetimonas pomaceti TaxID=2021998 RepID=A0ABX5NYK0_9PROT|nr:hypothetical protein C3920_14490 [Novacetimonas pomaceti]
MHHATLVGKVIVAIQPYVMQAGCRAIGRRRHGAPAGSAADDLCMQVIDRHERDLIIPLKRTSRSDV